MFSCIRVDLFTTMDSALCFRIGRMELCKYHRIGISNLPCRGVYGGFNFPLIGEMSQNVLTPADILSVHVILLSFTCFIRV
jgi:hypothetical protein